jgi:hypothetical protein
MKKAIFAALAFLGIGLPPVWLTPS